MDAEDSEPKEMDDGSQEVCKDASWIPMQGNALV